MGFPYSNKKLLSTDHVRWTFDSRREKWNRDGSWWAQIGNFWILIWFIALNSNIIQRFRELERCYYEFWWKGHFKKLMNPLHGLWEIEGRDILRKCLFFHLTYKKLSEPFLLHVEKATLTVTLPLALLWKSIAGTFLGFWILNHMSNNYCLPLGIMKVNRRKGGLIITHVSDTLMAMISPHFHLRFHTWHWLEHPLNAKQELAMLHLAKECHNWNDCF